MSTNTQAIFYFIAMVCFIFAAFVELRDPANRTFFGVHFGWLGLSLITFVAFWLLVKAS